MLPPRARRLEEQSELAVAQVAQVAQPRQAGVGGDGAEALRDARPVEKVEGARVAGAAEQRRARGGPEAAVGIARGVGREEQVEVGQARGDGARLPTRA